MDVPTREREYNHSILHKIFRRNELRTAVSEVQPDVRMAVTVPAPRPPVVKKPSKVFRGLFRLGGTPFWEKNLTTLFYGPRSQGKSLHQAKTVRDILEYLEGMYNLFPELPQSVIVSNQKFNPTIEAKYLNTRLFYWESIQQLKFCPRKNCWKKKFKVKGMLNATSVKFFRKHDPTSIKALPLPKFVEVPHRLHDCYLIIDDAATIIPADGWQDLPRWFRKLFAQAGHNGVHCIANIQDPLSCDINFRRYVDVCFKFQKVMGNRRPEAGKPPVNFVWGIYSSREIKAEELWIHGDKSEQEIEEERIARQEQDEMLRAAGRKVVRVVNNNWRKRYHLIRRRDTEIYDTLQNVPEYMPNKLEHIELKCIDPSCGKTHVRHRVI